MAFCQRATSTWTYNYNSPDHHRAIDPKPSPATAHSAMGVTKVSPQSIGIIREGESVGGWLARPLWKWSVMEDAPKRYTDDDDERWWEGDGPFTTNIPRRASTAAYQRRVMDRWSLLWSVETWESMAMMMCHVRHGNITSPRQSIHTPLFIDSSHFSPLILTSSIASLYFSSTHTLQQETISAGDGSNFPKAGDKLTMHYQWVVGSCVGWRDVWLCWSVMLVYNWYDKETMRTDWQEGMAFIPFH
jgi:hypothetical protein